MIKLILLSVALAIIVIQHQLFGWNAYPTTPLEMWMDGVGLVVITLSWFLPPRGRFL